MNLLWETAGILNELEYSTNDIAFIGSRDGKYSCSWNEFKILANKNYDNGFGAPEVATDLIILFKNNSWIERDSYDGSEWWKYVARFRSLDKTLPIKRLFAVEAGWETIEDIQKEQ